MPLPILSPRWLVQALVSAFLAILFLQSSLDKIIDRRGNLEFLTEHFAKSPLASTVRPMFAVITVIELSAGVLSAIGCAIIVLGGTSAVALWGATAAGVGITALFFGQRVAKDYVGAATLVPYFLLALVAILVLGGDGIVTL